jgi:glucose-6-phosphate 1-epimerase
VQTLQELTDNFTLPGVLEFDEPHAGMPRATISAPGCQAEFFLQGAHLTQWQPTDRWPALFTSQHSAFEPGKAIRGGIPVIFPWFGSPANSPVHPPADAPSHGFARTSPWTLQFAALAGEDLHLSLTLDHTEAMQQMGFAGLELAYHAVLGRELTVRLTVANTTDRPFTFEEALHAYLAVSSSGEISVTGLKDTVYLDKTDNFARKTQTSKSLKFEGEVDRPYLDTTGPVTLHDHVIDRDLTIFKTGSHTTVTWNPGAKLAARLPDLGDEEWRNFVCLETANAADNALTLEPGKAHTMEMCLHLERV